MGEPEPASAKLQPVTDKPDKPKRVIASPRSKPYEAIHVPRKAKHYSASMAELRQIANDNTVSRYAISMGWGFLSFAIGVGSNMIIESNPSDLAKKLVLFVVPMALVIAAVCFGVWLKTAPGHSGTLQNIIDESEIPEE
jgi:hypothetical protein